MQLIYGLLKEASMIPRHWGLTGLTSLLACRVNGADGEEIKGPSRQPFFHTPTILGDKLIPINLIKDMWETQPYVEEISVEFWPSLDFLTSDNRVVGHAHCVCAHNQFLTFAIVFFETLKGDNKILIIAKHWTGPFEKRNRFLLHTV